MRLDDLADPFGIEKVLVALGRLFRLHEIGVVAHRAEKHAETRKRSVGILVFGGIVLRHVLRHERRQPAVALPHDKVGGIRGVYDIDRVDVAAVLLVDALEHALGAGALDAQATPGNFASNDFAIRSARGRSTEVYQATLPSFLAASIKVGVIAVAGGAAARSGDAKTVEVATRSKP